MKLGTPKTPLSKLNPSNYLRTQAGVSDLRNMSQGYGSPSGQRPSRPIRKIKVGKVKK